MSTLAEFRAEIRSLGNFPSNDTRVTDAVIDREINRALKRIALLHDWPWLQSERNLITAPDQQTYALPSDFLRLNSLRHQDTATTLFVRSKTELDEIFGTGRPAAFAIWANRIRLAPTPAGEETLVLSYIKRENFLSGDTDAPLIPAYWEDGVVDCALGKVYLVVNKTEEAGLAEGRFQAWLTETQDNIKQTRQTPRVRVRPGSFI